MKGSHKVLPGKNTAQDHKYRPIFVVNKKDQWVKYNIVNMIEPSTNQTLRNALKDIP